MGGPKIGIVSYLPGFGGFLLPIGPRPQIGAFKVFLYKGFKFGVDILILDDHLSDWMGEG